MIVQVYINKLEMHNCCCVCDTIATIRGTFDHYIDMTIQEDPEISETEKVTRFGCGALLGVVVGISLAVKLALDSFGWSVAIVVGAVLVCGFLALKHGDEFWYAVFGGGSHWWRWW